MISAQRIAFTWALLTFAFVAVGSALAAPPAAEPPADTAAIGAVSPHEQAAIATIDTDSHVAIAEWDWEEFWKYWKKQLGKTAGVVGVVTLVLGLALLIVMSARGTR